MEWNKYKVIVPSGFEYYIIMGEWLKEGKYEFGEVIKIRELTDEQVEEFHNMEDILYIKWCEQLSDDFGI